jgi:short-subunit dehydrogenase
MSRDGTALVTGASAGIGKSFAHALAARGDDLVLVARDVARLERLAEDVHERHGVEAEVLGADLLADEGIVVVERRLRDASRPVGLLVNNAGMGTFGEFLTTDLGAAEREIRLNVLALVRLTHAALESMVPRRRGVVLNISSLAGYQPAPSSATYAATKAFVNSFTHSVHEECRREGVHVMLVCPGYTHTEFHERAGLGPTQIPEFMWQSPEQVVTAALRDLDRRRAVSIPGALNKTLGAASSVTPAAVTRRIAGMVMRRSG